MKRLAIPLYLLTLSCEGSQESNHKINGLHKYFF
jgi:hypothetical protein